MFATFTGQYANMSSKHSHVYFLACRLYENIRLKEVKCFSTKFIDTMFGGGMDSVFHPLNSHHISSLPDSGGSGVQIPSCKMILPAICLGSTARPEREVVALLLLFLNPGQCFSNIFWVGHNDEWSHNCTNASRIIYSRIYIHI